MKKILLLATVFLIAKYSTAQNNTLNYGIKAGLNIGKLALFPERSNRTERGNPGVSAGAFIKIPMGQKFNLQIDPSYNSHSTTLKFDPYNEAKEIDLTLQQISLPVQAGYFITPGVSINAGISANYNFHFQQKVVFDVGERTFDITDEVITFQPGLLGGLTFYTNKHIFADARYHRMLTNLYNTESADDKTRYRLGFVQIMIGYSF